MGVVITADNLTLESLLSKVNELAEAVTTNQLQYKKELDAKELENLRLKHELNQLKKMIFGSKSERFVPNGSPEQLSMGFETAILPPIATEQQVSYTRTSAGTASKHAGRLPLPASLLRQQIIIEPAGVDTSKLKKIGEEITEELEYAPGKLFVKQYIRPKYANPITGGILCAELPERPITKGIAGPALLAYIIISKFVNHMPVYRQIQQFAREGVNIPSSTMNDWIAACCQLLEPLYECLLKTVTSCDYIQADESVCLEAA